MPRPQTADKKTDQSPKLKKGQFGACSFTRRSPELLTTPTDRVLLERAFRMSHPITVRPLSPWAYVNFIPEDDSREAAAGGVAATSLVAQHYNLQHLKDRRSIAWHLSGAALTSRITRHWSADEVVCAAVDVLRQTSSSRPTPISPDRHPQARHRIELADTADAVVE